jgi:hypothetical protein
MLRVTGLRSLNTALARAERDVRVGLRREQREVAQPVARDASAMARGRIRNIGPVWSQTRIGLTRRSVYVATKPRGLRAGPAKRPNLAPLLMGRALRPALERNRGQIRRDFEQVLATAARRFNR